MDRRRDEIPAGVMTGKREFTEISGPTEAVVLMGLISTEHVSARSAKNGMPDRDFSDAIILITAKFNRIHEKEVRF